MAGMSLSSSGGPVVRGSAKRLPRPHRTRRMIDSCVRARRRLPRPAQSTQAALRSPPARRPPMPRLWTYRQTSQQRPGRKRRMQTYVRSVHAWQLPGRREVCPPRSWCTTSTKHFRLLPPQRPGREVRLGLPPPQCGLRLPAEITGRTAREAEMRRRGARLGLPRAAR